MVAVAHAGQNVKISVLLGGKGIYTEAVDARWETGGEPFEAAAATGEHLPCTPHVDDPMNSCGHVTSRVWHPRLSLLFAGVSDDAAFVNLAEERGGGFEVKRIAAEVGGAPVFLVVPWPGSTIIGRFRVSIPGTTDTNTLKDAGEPVFSENYQVKVEWLQNDEFDAGPLMAEIRPGRRR